MPTDPYDEILNRAESELSQEQMQRLIHELAQRSGRKNGPGPHSITELKGLGKEIWNAVDADDYVARERDSWDG